MIHKIIILVSLLCLISACTEEINEPKKINTEKTKSLKVKTVLPKVKKSVVKIEVKPYLPEIDEQGYVQLTEDRALIDQEIGLLEESRIETEAQIKQLIQQLNDNLGNSIEREQIQQELNQLTLSYKRHILALAKYNIRLQSP